MENKGIPYEIAQRGGLERRERALLTRAIRTVYQTIRDIFIPTEGEERLESRKSYISKEINRTP